MARISSYVDASPVVAADKWIGSDSVNKQQTKNFTAQKVADFINKTGGEEQNLRYTYNDTTAYATGSIAFANGGAANVPLNSITTFNVGAYQVGLTFKAGGGSLIEGRDYFISLLTNDPSISNFTFDLDGNSLVYTITHGMNKFPSVSVIEDGTNNQIFGNVTYNNLNQCTISFSSLVTGKATFN